MRIVRTDRVPRWAWPALAGLLLAALVTGLSLSFASAASTTSPGTELWAAPLQRGAASASARWIASWAAAPQGATPNSLSMQGFRNQTVRNIVYTSAGGSMVRVRVTNTFGATPLQVGEATIATQAGPRSGARLNPRSVRALSFGGQSSIVIPPGAEALSDPVKLTVKAMQSLEISVYVPVATGPATQHAFALTRTFVASGDHAADSAAGGFRAGSRSWFFVDGVDVLASSKQVGSVVAFGDSITDGVGSSGNGRWPNDLARRLKTRRGAQLGVVDEGIGGNRVLNSSPCCGENAVARFSRDVLGRAGIKAVILLEGVNDIGFSQSTGPLNAPHTDVSAAQIISGDQQLIAQAHAAGVEIFGATLTPFQGARYWTPAGEAKRDEINNWIRGSGSFDGVIDFARAVADPADPIRLNPRDDSGDHLHPNDRGYTAMAKAIDLSMLPGGRQETSAGTGRELKYLRPLQ